MDEERIAAAWQDPKLANVVYHDWEAGTYDDKWSISYDERCITYARELFDRTINDAEHAPVERALEIGSGTGFFLLNLMQSGVAKTGVLTDISSGMVRTSVANGQHLGLDVTGQVADVEALPFEDGSFDLVVGHAFLHHIPDVDKALREIVRVLVPGGRFVICGEPTRRGDVVARTLSRVTWKATRTITSLPKVRDRWARSAAELDASSREAALEAVVDLHTFEPERLAAACMRAGAVDIHLNTEELTAAWFGWPVRTFEAAVPASALGWGWASFAYRTWQRLNSVDRMVWSRIVPGGLFYNVCVSGVRP
ncbi:MAG TPA: methyltransferase domain-containing protein [Candidatus Nanopelagicales bacterium]|nr:methyltransferase domain-containing protein [Candidatus Nanopelagicales bacterium]